LFVSLPQDSQLFFCPIEISGKAKQFEQEGALRNVRRVLAEIIREHLLRFLYAAFIEQLLRVHVIMLPVLPAPRTRV
jgi:hypothetical protein